MLVQVLLEWKISEIGFKGQIAKAADGAMLKKGEAKLTIINNGPMYHSDDIKMIT